MTASDFWPLGNPGIGADSIFFVDDGGRWLCLDIYWTSAYFFPDSDAAFRFALFNEATQTRKMRPLNAQLPPGMR